MINDLAKLTVRIVIFRAFCVAIQDIRIRLRHVDRHEVLRFICIRAHILANCTIPNVLVEYSRIVIHMNVTIGNNDLLFEVMIPTNSQGTCAQFRRIILCEQLQLLTTKQTHQRVLDRMRTAIQINGILERIFQRINCLLLLFFDLFRYSLGYSNTALCRDSTSVFGHSGNFLNTGSNCCNLSIVINVQNITARFAHPIDLFNCRFFGIHNSRCLIRSSFLKRHRFTAVQCNLGYLININYGDCTACTFATTITRCRSNRCRAFSYAEHLPVIILCNTFIVTSPFQILV